MTRWDFQIPQLFVPQYMSVRASFPKLITWTRSPLAVCKIEDGVVNIQRRVVPRPTGLLCGFLLSGAFPKRFSRGFMDASADRGAIITLALPTSEVVQKCRGVMRSAHNSALQARKILFSWQEFCGICGVTRIRT